MAQTSAAKNAAQNKSANGIDPRRQAALDTALAQVEKSFGKGSAMRLGDRPEQDVEVIPTGSLALDMALGIGGLPKGRIVEIYGPESSGKTTLALHVVANAQKKGGVAAYIDAEHALDPAYARKLGVDTDSLIVSQPDNGEQALEIADMLIRSGALDVIVIDSVAALVPKAEIEGEMGDSRQWLCYMQESHSMPNSAYKNTHFCLYHSFPSQKYDKPCRSYPSRHYQWLSFLCCLLQTLGRPWPVQASARQAVL